MAVRHPLSGMIAFGIAGLFLGILALTYGLLGLIGGYFLNRWKGGMTHGTLVGLAIFFIHLLVQLGLIVIMTENSQTAVLEAGIRFYPNLTAGLLSIAFGGILGYLIDEEFGGM